MADPGFHALRPWPEIEADLSALEERRVQYDLLGRVQCARLQREGRKAGHDCSSAVRCTQDLLRALAAALDEARALTLRDCEGASLSLDAQDQLERVVAAARRAAEGLEVHRSCIASRSSFCG